MSGIKQKRKANRQQKRLSRHKRSILCISSVIILLVAVVSVSGVALQTKNKAYIAQEQELQEQIDEEKARAQEIEELEQYVGTDEYVEQTAKDKLGLVHEGEIIFKTK